MQTAENAKKEDMVSYLNQAKTANKLPNFWMSEEYVVKARLKIVEYKSTGVVSGFTSESSLITSEKDEFEWFFPPRNSMDNFFYQTSNYYADFIFTGNTVPTMPVNFLDYQYIYNPKNFLDLTGKKWKTFRKNIKKWQGNRPGKLKYEQIKGDEHQDEIEDLVLKWSDGRTLYDTEVFIRYMFDGENRWGLFKDNILIGMSVFDENFKFINYRYCIDNGDAFLNEYVRYCFYMSPVIQNKKKLVNDGGSLDSEGLRKFKLRLNPIYIGKVYSRKA